MKNKNIYRIGACAALALMPFFASCEREIDIDPENPDNLATAPKMDEVFIDGFSAGLGFQAWGNPTNFSVDNDIKHSGSASMCISVPDPDDVEGNWAGGVFYVENGRDLSDFNCLTFYAKASVGAAIEVGIGNYGDDAYSVGMSSVRLSFNWKKYIIPIPNASKLTCQKGLFYYSAGAVNGGGYGIWIDDLKFEYNPLLAHPRITDVNTAGFPAGEMEIGQDGKVECTVNMPNGTNQKLNVTSNFFTFTSSNPEVAIMEGNKIVFQGAKGEAVITAEEAEGEIRITDIYDFAPEPTLPAEDVLSVFCDKYGDWTGLGFNDYWYGDGQTTVDDKLNVGGNQMVHYSKFNWVGAKCYGERC